MEEIDDYALEAWIYNPYTQKILSRLKKDKESMHDLLLRRCKDTSDPHVREAYSNYSQLESMEKSIRGET
jgi:hypothetical protein